MCASETLQTSNRQGMERAAFGRRGDLSSTWSRAQSKGVHAVIVRNYVGTKRFTWCNTVINLILKDPGRTGTTGTEVSPDEGKPPEPN
jgi:hypothetical protein